MALPPASPHTHRRPGIHAPLWLGVLLLVVGLLPVAFQGTVKNVAADDAPVVPQRLATLSGSAQRLVVRDTPMCSTTGCASST